MKWPFDKAIRKQKHNISSQDSASLSTREDFYKRLHATDMSTSQDYTKDPYCPCDNALALGDCFSVLPRLENVTDRLDRGKSYKLTSSENGN